MFHSLLYDKMPEEKQLRGEKNCIGSWFHRIQFIAFGVIKSGPGGMCSKDYHLRWPRGRLSTHPLFSPSRPVVHEIVPPTFC